MTAFLAAWQQLDDGRDRAEFYRMWRVGASAGFTVPRALETMGPRAAPQVEALRQWLMEGTRRGKDVAHLVSSGRARFDAFESALLLLGVETGRLEDSLRLLADFYTRKHRLMLWVRKQMAYPLFTVLAATAIAPLPLLFSGRSTAYLGIVLSGLAGWMLGGGALVMALANHYGRKPALVRARLARALATAIETGLPLASAVRLAADASADDSVKEFVRAIDERTLSTQPVTAMLADCPHMTPDFLGVLQVAEATGNFGVVTRLADLYEDGFT